MVLFQVCFDCNSVAFVINGSYLEGFFFLCVCLILWRILCVSSAFFCVCLWGRNWQYRICTVCYGLKRRFEDFHLLLLFCVRALQMKLHLTVFIKCYIYWNFVKSLQCIIRFLLNEHNFSRLLFVRSIIQFCVEMLFDWNCGQFQIQWSGSITAASVQFR